MEYEILLEDLNRIILRKEKDRAVAELIFKDSENGNTLTPDALNELLQVTEYLKTRNDIWVVIVGAEGKHFSLGVDVSFINQIYGRDEKTFGDNLREQQLCLDAFEDLEKIKIAKITGYCIGGGLVLASICDFRFAASNSIFMLPEVKLGIAVIMGTKRISNLVGVARAKELILTGDRFKASRAHEMGLLTELCDFAALDERVSAYADKFLRLPPRTLGIASRIIDKGFGLDMRASQELEISAQAELLISPDLKEALDSHMEKRPAVFVGE